MSRATEALSLSDQPPDVQFGFLHPIPKQSGGDTGKSLQERLTLPLGVRLLLKEWKIGADPLAFAYHDPHNESIEEDAMSGAKGAISRPKSFPLANPRLPPTVVTSNDFQPPLPRIQFVTQSQPSPAARYDATSQHTNMDTGSQIGMPSTQILPGPYGNRLLSKKKPTKKRLGGF
jgi:hypothetical protein